MSNDGTPITNICRALFMILPEEDIPDTVTTAEELFDWLTVRDFSPKKPLFVVKNLIDPTKDDSIDEFAFTTTTLTCSKCKQKKAYTIAKQTRRSDEGQTIFARCVCGNPFKQAS